MWQGKGLLLACLVSADETNIILECVNGTGIDGGGGGRVPHFSAWEDSIGIVPPHFSSEKLRGMSPDSTLLSLKSRYIRLVARH